MDAHRRAHPEEIEVLIGTSSAAGKPFERRHLGEAEVAERQQIREAGRRSPAQHVASPDQAARNDAPGKRPAARADGRGGMVEGQEGQGKQTTQHPEQRHDPGGVALVGPGVCLSLFGEEPAEILSNVITARGHSGIRSACRRDVLEANGVRPRTANHR